MSWHSLCAEVCVAHLYWRSLLAKSGLELIVKIDVQRLLCAGIACVLSVCVSIVCGLNLVWLLNRYYRLSPRIDLCGFDAG